MPSGQRVHLLLRPANYMPRNTGRTTTKHTTRVKKTQKKERKHNLIKQSAWREVRESEDGRKLDLSGKELDVWLSTKMQRAREKSGCWKDEQQHGRKSGGRAMVVE